MNESGPFEFRSNIHAVDRYEEAFATYSAGVGNTPLCRLTVTLEQRRIEVALKLEKYNRTGSSKDRTACGLVAERISASRLRADSILLESTSGNLGVALAGIAAAIDIGCLAIVDPHVTPENIERMARLGAQVEFVRDPDGHGGYLLARLRRVQELLAADRDGRLIWTNQYSNQCNPQAHYHGTAVELHAQMANRVDAVMVPVSTGGTLAGVARYFREHSPETKVIAVDVPGSVALERSRGRRVLSGIGSGRKSDFLAPGDYDAVAVISAEDAIRACRALRTETGVLVGASSGAAIVAAARHAGSATSRVACICPDGGESYLSTIFDASWPATVGLGDCRGMPWPIKGLSCSEAV